MNAPPQAARDPDAVVLDIDLPRLGGEDVQREMAAHAQTRDIPIVVPAFVEPVGLPKPASSGAVCAVIESGQMPTVLLVASLEGLQVKRIDKKRQDACFGLASGCIIRSMENLIEADNERLRFGQVGISDVYALTARLSQLARAVRELPDTVEATAVRAELLGLITDLEQLRLIQSGTWWVGAKNPR